MKREELISLALKRIGTKNLNVLDGLTLVVDDVFYNFYVSDNIVIIEEI